MEIKYSSYKFSDDLFYKNIDYAMIKFEENSFEIFISPYFRYSNIYYIHSIAKTESKRVIYRTMKGSNDFSVMTPKNKYFISVSNDRRKIMIFNNFLKGIMLKN